MGSCFKYSDLWTFIYRPHKGLSGNGIETSDMGYEVLDVDDDAQL